MRDIHQTAVTLLAPGRGLLVADEYVDRVIAGAVRDAAAHATCTTSSYLRTALDCWGLESYLSGVLLTRDTFGATEQLRTLKTYREGGPPLLFGVRMDPYRRDGVGADLAELRVGGARFAEWRANIDPMTVGRGQVAVDAAALARGAAASQAEGVMPLLTVAMPDLASQSQAVTRAVVANALRALFDELDGQGVDLAALVLRMSMVLPGDAHRHQPAPTEVAAATLGVLEETVPPQVAGVAFLSGGQPVGRATTNLAAIVAAARQQGLPWRMTFAFTRALVAESVAAWACHPESVPQAQRELVQSCRAAAQAVAFRAGAASA